MANSHTVLSVSIPVPLKLHLFQLSELTIRYQFRASNSFSPNPQTPFLLCYYPASNTEWASEGVLENMALTIRSSFFSTTTTTKKSSPFFSSNQLHTLPFLSSYSIAAKPTLRLASRNNNTALRPIKCSVSEATEPKTGNSCSFMHMNFGLWMLCTVSAYSFIYYKLRIVNSACFLLFFPIILGSCIFPLLWILNCVVSYLHFREEAVHEKRRCQKHRDCCSCWPWKNNPSWCHAETN